MRVRRAVVVAALGAAAWAAGCGDDDGGPARAQDPGATSARRSAPAPKDFVGLVSEDVFAGDAAYRQRTLRRQARAGVGLLRQTFAWDEIERVEGRYDFSVHDEYVAAAAERGMAILPILFRPPTFHSRAGPGEQEATHPPRSNEEFARFARALVRRYGPDGELWRERPDLPRAPIRAWQVWNEPNLPVYWGGEPDAGEYGRMLAAVSEAVHAADAEAEVVTAGLPNSRLGIPFSRYLADLLAATSERDFDVLAIHPYARTDDGVLEAVAGARRALDRAGRTERGVWLTEVGWATEGPRSPFTVGRQAQARLVSSTLRRLAAERERLRVRGLVYFGWKDNPPYAGGKDFWGLHTGLLDIRSRPKPAYRAFRAAARAVRD